MQPCRIGGCHYRCGVSGGMQSCCCGRPSTMPDRGLPLSLWGIWWNAILLLRPAFSRLRTFMWFATAVAGLTVRLELLGVTSIVRALNLRPRLYTKLLDHFHSSGINLDRLSALWTHAVLQMFPHLVRVNGRLGPTPPVPVSVNGIDNYLPAWSAASPSSNASSTVGSI